MPTTSTDKPLHRATETILYAAPDGARDAERLLRERGHRLLSARNGVEALQLAVSRSPDLVLFDEDCELLDAASFLRIVRSNPRTARTPVLLASRAPGPGRVGKPIEEGALFAAIDAALAQARPGGAEAARQTPIEGVLDPLSVADLLQALHLQGRSGKLVLRGGRGEGAVWLEDGAIRDARLGGIEGKKALLRLLAMEEGRFELHPLGEPRPPRIDERVDFLLLEAATQQDELARVLARLPGRGERIVAAVAPEQIPMERPLVGALLRAMWGEPRTLQELLDGADASDLDVALALDELLRIGWARIAPGAGEDATPLLPPEVAHRLRRRLPVPAYGGLARGKLLLLSEDEGSLRQLLRRLASPGELRLTERPTEAGWGTVVALDLGEGMLLELVALPEGEELAPLAAFLAGGALGALAAGPVDTWDWLGAGRRWPVVEADPSDPLPALRALLAAL